jgi:pSer/pThr/pTyr-binding forkhead associated (FHA) protein
MAKLIMSLDNAVIREVSLDKERVTIGRKAHNDIQIDNLAVSGEHALIVTILKDSFLEDLGSTNGTLVNGNPVKKHILQNNDVIEIGKYKLKYVTEAPTGQTSVADFEKTMVLRAPIGKPSQPGQVAGSLGDTQINTASSAPRAQPASPPAPPPPSPAPLGPSATQSQPAVQAAPVPPSPPKPPEKLASIQILTGGAAGKELELTKNLTTLGKPGVQVAVITRRPHGYFITHVEGANFPVINGKTLDAQAHQLNDHDVIELAGVKMEFFFKSG